MLEQVSDGDVTVDKIRANCNVNLESPEGSITVAQIGERANATLKAARGVTIGRGIGAHSTVHILAGGDVKIGQMISKNCQITIISAQAQNEGDRADETSNPGTRVHIEGEIGEYSSAKITAQGDVIIGGGAHAHANLDIISLGGAISIDESIKGNAVATLTAAKGVRIGEEVSDSSVTIMAHGDVSVGQKIEQQADAKITSVTGSINIGQGLSGGATATLIADAGSITIAGGVDESSTVNWQALDFNCPQQGGTVNRLS